MKQSEFIRWLKSQGVELTNGANHMKAYYNGNQSTVPRHKGKEISESLRKAIIKQLGLKN